MSATDDKPNDLKNPLLKTEPKTIVSHGVSQQHGSFAVEVGVREPGLDIPVEQGSTVTAHILAPNVSGRNVSTDEGRGTRIVTP